MTTPLLALKGISEEIVAQIPDFSGKKLRVLVYPATGNSAEGHDTRHIPRCWPRLPRPSPPESLPVTVRLYRPTGPLYLRHPQAMKQVFADTLYWVASIMPGDPWYAPTLQAVAALGPLDLVRPRRCWRNFSRPTLGAARICIKSSQDRPRHPGQRPCNRTAPDT